MLIYNGQIIAGGGTIVLPMTRAEYEANKAILDSADVWVDLTDEPDQIATAEQIAYSVDGVQKGMNYIGDIATKAIAKVEPTDTALYLHEVGTGFINKNGDYCITDVQISVGGTITLGTNCHVVDGGISSNKAQKPSGTIQTLASITTNQTTPQNVLTVTEEGWYIIRGRIENSVSGWSGEILLNGDNILFMANVGVQYYALTVTVYCKVGDIISASVNNSALTLGVVVTKQ